MGGRSRKRRAIVPKSSIQQDQDDEKETMPAKTKNCQMTTTTNDIITDEENDNLALKIFLNPMIMGVITQYLPLRCLPTLRSTCKLWNKLMVPEYRARKCNFNSGYVVNIGKKASSDFRKASVDSALKKLSATTDNPFSAYKFREVQMSARNVQKLIAKVGGVMAHLELNLSNLTLDIATFRTLIFEQCQVLSSLVLTDDIKSAAIPAFWSSKLEPPKNQDEEIQTLGNLKKLRLELKTYSAEDLSYTTSDFALLYDLFKSGINLEDVEIEEHETTTTGLVLNGLVLDILCRLQQEEESDGGHLHKIQRIKFGEGVSMKNLESLVQLSATSSTSTYIGKSATAANRLALKELDLHPFANDGIFMDEEGIRLMNQFLSLQAPSLQKLTACLTPMISDEDTHEKNYKLDLPVMSCLKDLELEIKYYPPPQQAAAAAVNANNAAGLNGNRERLPNITFDSLETNFPNLQKLTLLRMDWMVDEDYYEEYDESDEDEEEEQEDYEDENLAIRQVKRTAFMNQLGLGISSHTRITQLSVWLGDDSSYLVDYGSLFPAVKQLKIIFKRQLFQEVWSVWPGLERINIGVLFHPREAEIDSGITGIPIQSLNALKKAAAAEKAKEAKEGQSEVHSQGQGSSKRKKGNESKELDWKELKTQAGISDLTELREFHLDMFGRVNDATFMTDLSGLYGFIPAATSSSLRTIYIKDCTKFTPDCVTAVEAACGPHGDFVPIDKGVPRQNEERARNRRLYHRRR